jgi:hypothetical protein
MKTGRRHQPRGEPSRGAKSGGAEPSMSRANSSVRFQSAGLVNGGPVQVLHQS